MPRSSQSTEAPETSRRREQLEEITRIIVEVSGRLHDSTTNRSKKLSQLTSVSNGLYEEVDKLTKKAPAEPVTDLVLEHLNDIIRETKELVAEDTYVQRLREFVPAGDNPELRDAIIVLRQIRQGLERFGGTTTQFEKSARSLVFDGRAVKLALEYYLETGMTPDQDYFQEQLGYVPREWLSGENHLHQEFNWTRLDRLPLAEHFALEL